MQKEIALNKDAQCDNDTLRQAVETLTVATDDQLEEIKSEKWYNRVFNMVTFADKNDVRLADQISTVAQAQLILAELIYRLSQNDSGISQMLVEAMGDIETLSEHDNVLIEMIQSMKSESLGIHEDTNLGELTDVEKSVLSSCLFELRNNATGSSETQKKFANIILSEIGNAPIMDNLSAALDRLDASSKRKILSCCMKYMFLADFTENTYDQFNDFIDEFDLGNKTMKSIKDQIINLYDLCGIDGFFAQYQFPEKSLPNYFYVEFAEPDLSYLTPEKKKMLGISRECAEIYFENESYYLNGKHVSSCSYILCEENGNLIALHKQTGEKKTVLAGLKSASDILDKGQICTIYDLAFYVIGDGLYYVDLDNLKTGFVLNFKKKKDEEGNPIEIEHLEIAKTEKSMYIIYRNGSCYSIDLKIGNGSQRILKGISSDHIKNGDHIYYIDFDDAEDERDDNVMKYCVLRYGLNNNQVTRASKTFGRFRWNDINNKFKDSFFIGGYNNYFVVILETETFGRKRNLEGFYFNLSEDGVLPVHKFDISSENIFQIEVFENNLIYVDADNNYELIKYDFTKNKKKIIEKGYGYTDSRDLIDRIYLNKEDFQHAYEYFRLGPWIYTLNMETLEHKLHCIV